MRIGLNARARHLRPLELTLDLAVTQEEALLGREAIHDGALLPLQRTQERQKCQAKSSEVCNVLTQRQLSPETSSR
jgi:hypothetical protein